MKQVKWEIELNVPKGKIKTFVYSEDGTNIVDRFKPEYQCKQPTKTPKKRTRKWYKEVQTYGINQAKWKSAIDWCANRGMEFKILTEKHLNPQYK